MEALRLIMKEIRHGKEYGCEYCIFSESADIITLLDRIKKLAK